MKVIAVHFSVNFIDVLYHYVWCNIVFYERHLSSLVWLFTNFVNKSTDSELKISLQTKCSRRYFDITNLYINFTIFINNSKIWVKKCWILTRRSEHTHCQNISISWGELAGSSCFSYLDVSRNEVFNTLIHAISFWSIPAFFLLLSTRLIYQNDHHIFKHPL